MNDSDWAISALIEIDQARIARIQGKEGKARVCARRAAGLVVNEYLRRRGIRIESPNALARLKYLRDMREVAPRARELAEHFLQRVTPAHELPLDTDLIQDACELAQALLTTEL
jgi:hypothetical protein